jgi:hypothetical protein
MVMEDGRHFRRHQKVGILRLSTDYSAPEPTLMQVLVMMDGRHFAWHHKVVIFRSSTDHSVPEPMLMLLLVKEVGRHFGRHHKVVIFSLLSDYLTQALRKFKVKMRDGTHHAGLLLDRRLTRIP